jgi:DNA-binding NtrC family response regulator
MTRDRQRPRLLLVDDEQEFLAATGRALENRGFDVETVASAGIALRLTQLFRFDVSVLDLRMPEMDGIELLVRLKKRWPWLPVIILTAYGTVRDARRATSCGCYEYLSKPCDLEVLARLAREAIEKARPESVSDPHERIRVLLVDDDQEHLDSLATVLRRRYMDVTKASNGSQALAILDERFHDVVVLDVMMPGMHGLEVLQRIKRRSATTEVLLLTGHPSALGALEGAMSGATSYLVKPHGVERLVKMIRSAYCRRWGGLEDPALAI